MSQFFGNLISPLLRLIKEGKFTFQDIKRAVSDEVYILKLLYPYVAERQSAIFALLWGLWLMLPWKHQFNALFNASPSFSIIRAYTTQREWAVSSFLLGLAHIFSIYLQGHPIQGQLLFPKVLRKICLFLQTLIWTSLATATTLAYPPSPGIVTFGFFGFGAWVAFRETREPSTVLSLVTPTHVEERECYGNSS